MDEIKNINITLIDRPDNPMRISFDENDIETLKQSIAENGIMVPLLVREKSGRYEVIDGDSRLEAAHRLRIGQVPCMVRTSSDSETIILRMLANLDRSNPDVVSEAVCIARAISTGTISAEEIAAKLKRGVAWIDDRLAIAEMPDHFKDALRAKVVPLGVALELFKIDHERTRDEWFNSAIRDGMSVAGARNAVHEYEKFKYIWEAEKTPADKQIVPAVPPVLLFPCAACGTEARQEDLQFVRIHRERCPEVASVEKS